MKVWWWFCAFGTACNDRKTGDGTKVDRGRTAKTATRLRGGRRTSVSLAHRPAGESSNQSQTACAMPAWTYLLNAFFSSATAQSPASSAWSITPPMLKKPWKTPS